MKIFYQRYRRRKKNTFDTAKIQTKLYIEMHRIHVKSFSGLACLSDLWGLLWWVSSSHVYTSQHVFYVSRYVVTVGDKAQYTSCEGLGFEYRCCSHQPIWPKDAICTLRATIWRNTRRMRQYHWIHHYKENRQYFRRLIWQISLLKFCGKMLTPGKTYTFNYFTKTTVHRERKRAELLTLQTDHESISWILLLE